MSEIKEKVKKIQDRYDTSIKAYQSLIDTLEKQKWEKIKEIQATCKHRIYKWETKSEGTLRFCDDCGKIFTGKFQKGNQLMFRSKTSTLLRDYEFEEKLKEKKK